MIKEELIKLTDDQVKAKILEIRSRLGMSTQICDHCLGSGYDPHPNHSTAYPICTFCEGTGYINHYTKNIHESRTGKITNGPQPINR